MIAAAAICLALGRGEGVQTSAQTLHPAPDPEKEQELRKKLRQENSRNKLLLSSLLGRLRQAQDAASAKVLEDAIWKVWLKSGSDTVNLLMQQVLRAMSRQNLELSLKLLDSIVELVPEYAAGWNKRATVLYFRGEYQRSYDDIERVLELEPRHFGALAGLGLVLRAMGDKKGALSAFRRALNIHPFLPGPKQAVKELTKEVEGQGI
ncbi:MAG: tetratricopeptide repeat protein [Gammaproteobacteria bacterium]|nr:tetratricopeptide repeat protein [Gammaproteobacteria bacterium]